MLQKKYYLHTWTHADTDEETKIVDDTVHPFILDDIGLRFEDWYQDDMFDAINEIILTERLKCLIDYWFSDHKIKFTPIERVEYGLNFKDNYPHATLGKFWRCEPKGIPGVDDFGVWKRMYLVISEKALIFLREHSVYYAESDEIIGDIDSYFNSEKNEFWM